MYMSVLLTYQVDCKGEGDGETDRYNVKEFFRVRYSENQQMYLLDYNRTMNELFDGEADVDENGVLLGVTQADVDYLVNKEGTVVSFVQERELWNYNKEDGELSCVFRYADGGDNVQNAYDQHSVQLVSIDKDGSTTFTVSGYVNRGTS